MSNLGWIEHEKRFDYLSQDQSKLYADVIASSDEKDLVIKKLLEQIAADSRAAHCASRY